MATRRKVSRAAQPVEVRLAQPADRPIQIRYVCPTTGKAVRRSTGTRDRDVAERMRDELAARLLLGLADPAATTPAVGNPDMPWDEFREQYRRLHLPTLRERSAASAESRLDLSEAILNPRRLIDVATPAALADLQARLLAGEQSRRSKPRSPYTVRGYLAAVLAALNWAYLQGWLDQPPRVRKVRAATSNPMKGRPITPTEFDAMLEATLGVVGEEAASSWRYVLRGLWESGLRLGELLSMDWSSGRGIQPRWVAGREPELWIPGTLQKNGKDEVIPLLPAFASLLLETPEFDRAGAVFRPLPLQKRAGEAGAQRPQADWVSKVIVRIGRTAGVVVEEEDQRTGRPIKHASAHDLRRSCAERLREAGVPPLLIARVMRHSSWQTTARHYAPGNIQSEAKALRDLLTESDHE